VSSFIFQLPLQLLFLECHSLENEFLQEQKRQLVNSQGQDVEADTRGNPISSDRSDGKLNKQDESPPTSEHYSEPNDYEQANLSKQEDTNDPGKVGLSEDIDMKGNQEALDNPIDMDQSVPLFAWMKFARRLDVWKRVGCRVAKNPVIWGITGGFFLSLTTIGPRFLNPSSAEYVPGLGWFSAMCAWFGGRCFWTQNGGSTSYD